MGKRANPKGLRLVQNKDWISSFYSDPFNYSNIVGQDYLIYDSILNFFAGILHSHVCDIKISRRGYEIFIHVDVLNDAKNQKRVRFFLGRRRRRKLRKRNIAYSTRISQWKPSEFFNFSYPHAISVGTVHTKDFGPSKRIPLRSISARDLSRSPYYFFEEGMTRRSSMTCPWRLPVKSGRKDLSFWLSYMLKAPVFITSRNIASGGTLLFQKFWRMSSEKDIRRAPLYRNVTARLIYLIYHAIYYQNSLLLCRYLAKYLPTFCKKRRKERKVFPFFRFLSNVFRILDNRKFLEESSFKGVRVCFKGRYNGMRRKKKITISRGNLSINTFRDNVSYYKSDSFTLFGVTGIKVWIISSEKCHFVAEKKFVSKNELSKNGKH